MNEFITNPLSFRWNFNNTIFDKAGLKFPYFNCINNLEMCPQKSALCTVRKIHINISMFSEV